MGPFHSNAEKHSDSRVFSPEQRSLESFDSNKRGKNA